MPKKIHLEIPEPCHESWDQMTADEKGRFCGSCQKQVIDFSTMDDVQVFAFFRKAGNRSVCGRFSDGQLDRAIAMPKKRIPWLPYFLQFLIPLLLASFKSNAQQKIALKDSTELRPQSRTLGKVVRTLPGTKQVLKLITGKVLDESGQGIPNASVYIKGSTIGTSTDEQGSFSLSINGNGKVTLIASCLGFAAMEVNIDPSVNPVCTIQLNSQNDMLMGIVVVADSPAAKKERVRFSPEVPASETNLKKKDSASSGFRIYPNPVSAGGELIIESNDLADGEYSIELMNIQGGKVHFCRAEHNSPIRLPAVPAGVYLVSLIHIADGSRFTEKLVVQ